MKRTILILFMFATFSSAYAQESSTLRWKLIKGDDAKLLYNMIDADYSLNTLEESLKLTFTKKIQGLVCNREVTVERMIDSSLFSYTCKFDSLLDVESQYSLFSYLQQIITDENSKFYFENHPLVDIEEIKENMPSRTKTILNIGSLVLVESYSRHPEAWNLPPLYDFSGFGY